MFKTSDDGLMIEVARGNEKAFTELFDRHASRVLGYCTRFMGSLTRGEDVAQEVWIKVVRAAGSYRGEGKFSSWVLRIARTSCLSEFRARPSQNETALDDAPESEMADVTAEGIEALMEREQTIEAVRKKIDALPEMQRVVLTMWMSEELSYDRLSTELGLSISAVKSLLFRAKQNLEKEMRTVS